MVLVCRGHNTAGGHQHTEQEPTAGPGGAAHSTQGTRPPQGGTQHRGGAQGGTTPRGAPAHRGAGAGASHPPIYTIYKLYISGYGLFLVSTLLGTLQSSESGYKPVVRRKRCMDPCSGRQLIDEWAVNSHYSQLVSLNQTADAEPTTRVGPRGMRVPCGNQALTPSRTIRPEPQ